MTTLRTITIRIALAAACFVVAAVATSSHDMAFAMTRIPAPHHATRHAVHERLSSVVTDASAVEAAFLTGRINTLHDRICNGTGDCSIDVTFDNASHAAHIKHYAGSPRDAGSPTRAIIHWYAGHR